MMGNGLGRLLPYIALNAVIVLTFVVLGVALDFPFRFMVAFVIAETLVSLLIVQQLARRN